MKKNHKNLTQLYKDMGLSLHEVYKWFRKASTKRLIHELESKEKGFTEEWFRRTVVENPVNGLKLLRECACIDVTEGNQGRVMVHPLLYKDFKLTYDINFKMQVLKAA